jgi:hypothetical protein
MKRLIFLSILSSMMFLLNAQNAQNSILANFGSGTCSNSNAPTFSLIANPLSAPSILSNCDLLPIMPNFYNVYVAYNPKDNNFYVADIRTGTTKIWIINEGLPGSITCPTLSATPTYTYTNGFVPNNFEFDANGDVWSLRSYNVSIGQCIMDKFDEATGIVLFTKTLQFPTGNFPSDIGNGDITILPNGRMFATLGASPSQLYEIVNYTSGASNATATYLQTMPFPCYGIAYINGQLEITGTDIATSCYYYDYDIASNTLGAKTTFQNGQSPIDNTSVTASIGSSKRLLNQTLINGNTADLTYEIHAKNIGNVALSLANIIDDLGAIYGAANVSNVTTSFAVGGNPAGLVLNAAYDGTSVTSLLNAGQILPNQTLVTTNNFVTILVKCRVSNLNTTSTYYNTAIAKGTIGSGANQINVADSSNNGATISVDPNNDGNAGSNGENVKTPFNFAILLPVKFVSAQAIYISGNMVKLHWTIATPTTKNSIFEIEKSLDGIQWNNIGILPLVNETQAQYVFADNAFTNAKAFYRIKEIDVDGKFVYSTILFVKKNTTNDKISIFPSPANNLVNIVTNATIINNMQVTITDLQGRKLNTQNLTNPISQINTSNLNSGIYLFTINNETEKIVYRISIIH